MSAFTQDMSGANGVGIHLATRQAMGASETLLTANGEVLLTDADAVWLAVMLLTAAGEDDLAHHVNTAWDKP